MTTSKQHLKNSHEGYNKNELELIMGEFTRLQHSRQEEYSKNTLTEWVKSFYERGLPAKAVCRMIKAVREDSKSYRKLCFTDFLYAPLNGVSTAYDTDDPTGYYMVVLTCKCGKSTTVKKYDAHDFPRDIICTRCNRVLPPHKLGTIAGRVKENFEEVRW